MFSIIYLIGCYVKGNKRTNPGELIRWRGRRSAVKRRVDPDLHPWRLADRPRLRVAAASHRPHRAAARQAADTVRVPRRREVPKPTPLCDLSIRPWASRVDVLPTAEAPGPAVRGVRTRLAALAESSRHSEIQTRDDNP